MKQKLLFTEETEVSPEKSLAEISALLVASGARSITSDHAGGKVTGLAFSMPYGAMVVPYKLPVRIEPVFQYLQNRRADAWSKNNYAERDRNKAERIAWRQLFWWLKSQMALIQLGMSEPAEVLMPYAIGAGGETMFEAYRGKLLAAPSS